MTELAAAFELFRRGRFADARQAALRIVDGEPQSFWAFYLAALSCAFEPDLPEFEKYLNLLDEFEAQNVYLHYLKAYHALLLADVEKALWHYLEITDDAEGWLARSLVKKFRKIKALKDIEYRVADFIVLPAELPPPVVVREKKKRPEATGWQFEPAKKEPRPRSPGIVSFPYRRVFIGGFAAFCLVAVAVLVYQHMNRPQRTIPDPRVEDSAAVMPVTEPQKILYTYKTREGIINDFNRAKQLLKESKVNQSRLLLNRLIYSNADFQTREKARTFTGFIPDPAFTEFNDNVSAQDLLANPKLRVDSVVVVGGELRDSAEEAGGTLHQFIVQDGEEYRFHAFQPGQLNTEKLESPTANRIQVYGRFKGLVGGQKTIYLEVLRVWKSR